jgi:hypothetical protein
MITKANLVAVENEGLIILLNEEVLIMCFNYFYAGILVGVNDKYIKLKNCHIVYETGEWSAKNYKDAQKVSEEHYIQLSSIESYTKTSKLKLK